MSINPDIESPEFLRGAMIFGMEVAYEIGETILPLFYSGDFEVENPDSLEKMATEGDKHALKVLSMRIDGHKSYGFQKLTEESGNEEAMRAIAEGSGFYWVWDEVDGTYNYSRRNPIWGVSGALVRNLQPVVGVIYLPVFKELYFCFKGGGSYRARVDEKPTQFAEIIKEENRIFVSRIDKLRNASAYFGYPHNTIKEQERGLALMERLMQPSIPPIFKALKRAGSSVTSLCWLAEGTGDVWVVNSQDNQPYWNGPWDFAAGVLLVEEAGGRFSDYNGRNRGIRTLDRLATNGLLHDEMISLLKDF